MKVHRMTKVSAQTWELTLPADELPRMFRPDFIVSSNAYGATSEQASLPTTGLLKLNGTALSVYPIYTYHAYFTQYGWYAIRAGIEARITLELTGREQLSTTDPCVFISYLSQSDREYKSLMGRMVWRTFKDEIRLQAGTLSLKQFPFGPEKWRSRYNSDEGAGAYLPLPPNIYGVSFEYKVETNSDWASGVHWSTNKFCHDAKSFARNNHNGDFKEFREETTELASESNILLTVTQFWQWVELRNIRVLIPEFRKDEVW